MRMILGARLPLCIQAERMGLNSRPLNANIALSQSLSVGLDAQGFGASSLVALTLASLNMHMRAA